MKTHKKNTAARVISMCLCDSRLLSFFHRLCSSVLSSSVSRLLMHFPFPKRPFFFLSRERVPVPRLQHDCVSSLQAHMVFWFPRLPACTFCAFFPFSFPVPPEQCVHAYTSCTSQTTSNGAHAVCSRACSLHSFFFRSPTTVEH